MATSSRDVSTSDWTKTPIPVGGTGFVKAKFDSNGKPNIQNKTVTVTANTWPKQTVLRFKAMVTPKADGAGGPGDPDPDSPDDPDSPGASDPTDKP